MATIRIAGYEILDPIGDGAMSRVFKARQTSLNRIVAVKVLREEHASDSTALAQFKLEANATATLKHPNILQVYEAGEAGGLPYFTMELAAAYSVESWVSRKGRLDEADVLTIADCVGRALRYAWDRAGLIHCDLKPGNLLVDEDGLIKVADFSGLSRDNLEPESELLREVTIGTPNYMSPEQCRGLPDLDCRADIYGLGCVLYHLLSGRIPFADSDPKETMRRQIEEYLPDMSEFVRASLPTVLLIESMLVKSRDARYADWSRALADIARAQGGRRPAQPVPAAGASTMRRSAPLAPPGAPPRRLAFPKLEATPGAGSARVPGGTRRGSRRGRLAVLATLAVLLAGLDAWLLFGPFRRPAPETETARVEPAPPRPPPAEEPLVTEAPDPEPGVPGEPVPDPETEPPQIVEAPDPEPEAPPPDPELERARARAAFLEYLDAMQPTLSLSRRRAWDPARDGLTRWLEARPGHPHEADARVQIERLRRPPELLRLLTARADALRGMTVEAPGGFQGAILGFRGSLIRIQRRLGEGFAEVEFEASQLRTADLVALLRRADPESADAHEAVVHLAHGDFPSAAAVLGGMRPEAAAPLRQWLEDWRRLALNQQARAALADVRELVVQSQFAEAAARAERIREVFRDTDMLDWVQGAEFEELAAVIEQEVLFAEALSPPDAAREPEEDPDDDPSAIDLLTPGELVQRMSAYHGRAIRLRFRARAEISLAGATRHQSELISEDGRVAVEFGDEALRWVRALPLYSIRNRDRFVYGRVNAESGVLELLGRTRRMLIGHRGSEYAW